MASCTKSRKLAGLLALAFWLLLHVQSFSQIDSTLLQRLCGPGIGIMAGTLGVDAGVGLEISSPSFLKKRFYLRVKGGINWSEWYKAQVDDYVTYPFLGASLVFNTRPMNRTRMFVEAGEFVLFPSDNFSEKKSVYGFSASTGAEYFVAHNPHLTFSYFFGGGLSLCYTSAEKLENNPSYGNGFVFSTGLRAYF
jgi:hypothetical protein